jgi:hypothetical protein
LAIGVQKLTQADRARTVADSSPARLAARGVAAAAGEKDLVGELDLEAAGAGVALNAPARSSVVAARQP